MSNFRGISLMSIAAKVFNRVILNRIYDEISLHLRPFQAGFRRGKSCTEQIHIIRRILEQYHQKNIPTFMIFIDFKKAFDSINKDTMWKILRHYGEPEKIVNIIEYLYDGSISAVRIDGTLSQEFLITTRVLQGDTLAPFLFILVLDYVLQNTESTTGLQTHPDELLPNLDFADDIVLLDQGKMEASEHFQSIESSAKKVGLSINYDKTKIMIETIENPETEVIKGKTVIRIAKNAYLEVLDDFKYLDAYIVNCHTDFKRRKGLAWSMEPISEAHHCLEIKRDFSISETTPV